MSSFYVLNQKFVPQPGFGAASATAPVSLASAMTSATLTTNTERLSLTAQVTVAAFTSGSLTASVQQSVDGLGWNTVSTSSALAAAGSVVIGPIPCTAPFYRVITTPTSFVGTGYAAIVTQNRA